MDIRTLTSEDVAEVLGCDVQRINALAAAHRLPAIKYGRSWRFPVDALHQYLHQEANAHLNSSVTTTSKLPGSRSHRSLPDLTRTVKVA